MDQASTWGVLGPERIVHLVETGSTNAEAMRLAGDGAPSGTWVIADGQTAGRGRSGRDWVSPPGNFHATLIIRDVFPLEKAAQLALVSGVAVHAALMAVHTAKAMLGEIIQMGAARVGATLVAQAQGLLKQLA